MNHTGFVVGILVHTDKGLVPIQDIKVGDLILSKPVLSKPESGIGDIEYKSVISTFKSSEKKRVFKVEYFNETADARGEEGRNYILCTNNHPFRVKRNPEDLEGEWLSAERLPPGYLISAHGDTIALDDYSFIPVRTLPNFPEGTAYTQSIEEHDLWETDGLVQFVKFTDNGYQFVSLANTEEAFKEEIKIVNLQASYEGRIVRESKITNKKSHEIALYTIDKYGDATGLSEDSIHEQMRRYNDVCPNPYEDHVYNIEVADHHTYSVGHDAVWVRNANCTKTTQE